MTYRGVPAGSHDRLDRLVRLAADRAIVGPACKDKIGSELRRSGGDALSRGAVDPHQRMHLMRQRGRQLVEPGTGRPRGRRPGAQLLVRRHLDDMDRCQLGASGRPPRGRQVREPDEIDVVDDRDKDPRRLSEERHGTGPL